MVRLEMTMKMSRFWVPHPLLAAWLGPEEKILGSRGPMSHEWRQASARVIIDSASEVQQ
jgi:hypothetical protein